MKTRIITIDGPAGAGKTTVSRQLSQKLGCVYVDTGALYRGVAYEIDRQIIDWKNEQVLADFLKTLDLTFEMQNGNLILTSSGVDVSGYIRTEKISMLASDTSAHPMIRAALLDIQRRIGRSRDAVFEGRDMGTVVFPDADFKFFLHADLDIRARRRFDESPRDVQTVDAVKKQMALRDKNDSSRKTAPLKPADDAVNVDSTELTVDQVVDRMIEIIQG